jgi:hypothetical protein
MANVVAKLLPSEAAGELLPSIAGFEQRTRRRHGTIVQWPSNRLWPPNADELCASGQAIYRIARQADF